MILIKHSIRLLLQITIKKSMLLKAECSLLIQNKDYDILCKISVSTL